jgi:hypothetical protein
MIDPHSEPEPGNGRFFAGFALAAALSLAIWGGAGIGLETIHPHFARAAYHKVKPALHEARLWSRAAIGTLLS